MIFIFLLIAGYTLYVILKDRDEHQIDMVNKLAPLDRLKVQLVDGKISEEEYLRRKKILEGN